MLKSRTAHLYLLGLATSVLSCHTGNLHPALPKFSFQIIDSFSTGIKGSEIVGIDINKKTSNFLFIDNRRGSTVYETDVHGAILHQFAPLGEGPDKIGAKISNIGYFSDSSVIISADRGYYVFDLNGHILRKFASENPETVGGFEKKMRLFRNNDGDTVAASVFRSPLSYDFILRNTAGSKEFIDQVRFLTFNDLNTGKYNLKFGYEQGGLHKQYKYDFRERTLFEYLPSDRSFYLIYAPEQKLYIYSDRDGFTSPHTAPLFLNHYELPIKYKLGESGSVRDYSRSLLVNSAIDQLCAGDSSLILTYRTGMPERAYDEVRTNEQTGAAFVKYARFFCVLFQNGRQVCDEMELPPHCYQVAFYKSPDYIVLSYAKSGDTEEGDNKYYICRLAS